MGSSRYITGIYNYCDYWCARCPFTRRCRNFAMGPELTRLAKGEVPEDHDATNRGFWDQLAERVRNKTVESRLAPSWDDAGRGDSEWDDLQPDPAYEERERSLEESMAKHPLVVGSQEYMLRVGRWLKAAVGDLKAFAQELLESAGDAFDNADHEEQAREMGDLIDVVAWYHTLVRAKLARAVRSLLESGDKDVPEVLVESRSYDANGSAKLSLVSIERSIAAWLRLRELLPAQEGEILSLLAILGRLRKRLHADFPGAAGFRRPGFEGGSMFDEEE